MKINNIYPAFMGEVNKFGIGAPCVFVRTSGCNLRCYWKTLGELCDTPEALTSVNGTPMTPEEVVEEVTKYRIPLVCLTGGEPLLQPLAELDSLFSLLREHGIWEVVETNGSCRIQPYLHHPNVSFVVDYKGASTGEHELMAIGNWSIMRKDDWLKFVVYNEADIDNMMRWCEHNHGTFQGHISAGLFWGTPRVSYGTTDVGIDTDTRCSAHLLQRIILEHPEYHIHLNMQTHKLICLYDRNPEIAGKVIAPKDL